MIDFFLSYGPEAHALAFVAGSSRLITFMIIAPFVGNSTLGVTGKGAVSLALYFILHPMILGQVGALDLQSSTIVLRMTAIIAKEIFLGLMLGFLASSIFWALESAGLFIDNQRGAGQATTTDPISSNQSSPTGSFLFQSTTYVFYVSGAFLSFLAFLFSSFIFWPVVEFLPSAFMLNPESAAFFGDCVSKLMLNVVLLAGPVVLACLFTDISLGLINRFASQLNVYVLSMPIKSGLSSFLLIFYFSILLLDIPERFSLFEVDVRALLRLMP